MPANVIGLDCKGYRNTGSWGTPTWSEVTVIRDVRQRIEVGEGTLQKRGDLWERSKPGFKRGSVEFDVLYDPTDTNWEAIKSAVLNRTTIEMAFMDGAIATAGNEGLRAVFYLFSMEREEQMEEGVTVSHTAKPAPDSNGPVWYEVS